MIITGTTIKGGKYYGAIPDPYFNLVTLLLPANGANGAQNETFVDGSTNNFALTASGNPTQGSMSPFAPGGYSVYFDSTNSLSMTANAAFLFPGDFTIEAWVYMPAISAGPYSIFGSASAAEVFDFRVYQNNIQVSLNAGAGSNLGLGSLAINTWTHLALVRSGSSVNCYVNGTQTATTLTNSSTLGYSDRTMYVGESGGGNRFVGYISNLRVVKGTAVYTANFTPPTKNLTAITNTSLLTCQSNRFIDNSSNGLALTITGAPVVSPVSPFLPVNRYNISANGGSAVFDGSGDWIKTAAVNETAFAFGTGDFTWECWIYPVSGGNNRIIGFATTAGTVQAQLYVSDTTIAYDQGAGTPYTQTYSQSFNNQWSHIAVSRVSGTTRVFVNGVQLGASFSDTIDFAASRFAMATDPSSSTVFYAGYITGVKIIKGTGLYTANFTCPTSMPTATNAQLLLNFTNAGIMDASAKNNLETVGNTSLSTAQSKWGTSSIYFDGTGDWLFGALGSSNLTSRLGTNNFTIELWVYLDSADIGSARGLVSKGTSTTGYSLALNNTEKVVFFFTSSSITSTGSIPTDSWVHVAVVRAGTGSNLTKIYINGVNDGTGTVSTDFNQTSNLYVGASRTAATPMKGYIQDLRITRGVARYTANFTPPITPFATQ